jgi:hypothetical protein
VTPLVLDEDVARVGRDWVDDPAVGTGISGEADEDVVQEPAEGQPELTLDSPPVRCSCGP